MTAPMLTDEELGAAMALRGLPLALIKIHENDPSTDGTGDQRVGDDLEHETFDCRACAGTGLATRASAGEG